MESGTWTAQAIAQTNWLVVVDTSPVPELIQSWDLGAGESAVLTWGCTSNTKVIVDDLAARRCGFGDCSTGNAWSSSTVKQRGTIAAARPSCEQLRDSGMYLSERVTNQALA
jgi:predicted nucleic acid-binding protein